MKKLFKRGLIALTLMLGMTFAAPQNASAESWYIHGGTIHQRDVDIYEEDGRLVTDILRFDVGGGYDMLVVFSDGTWRWFRYWE